MKRKASRPSFFIGWDVGGWNCDDNPRSRDAIVILDDELAIVGKPWRGNLRKCIVDSITTSDWLTALFGKCEAQYPELPPSITMAIDAPLGFSDEFVNLITRKGFVEADRTSGLNRYLFRYTERHLFEKKLRPLSAIKDMIGSQATKGMHVLAKFATRTESCGVWTDGKAFRAIETYPAACRATLPEKTPRGRKPSRWNSDVNDAHVCALVAYLFAKKRTDLEKPPAKVPVGEGWIWIPRAKARGWIHENIDSPRPHR